MSVNGNQPPAPARPRLWWRLVIACTGLYVLLLASNYFLMWHTGSTLFWTAAQTLLVTFAALAAAKDLFAARSQRPLRGIERIMLMSAILLVLLWLAGLLLTSTSPGGRASVLHLLIGLLVAIPVLPIAALAVPGAIVFRRARPF